MAALCNQHRRARGHPVRPLHPGGNAREGAQSLHPIFRVVSNFQRTIQSKTLGTDQAIGGLPLLREPLNSRVGAKRWPLAGWGGGNGALDSCGVFASSEGKRTLWSE